MLRTSTCKKPGISVIRSLGMNENGAVLVIALAFVALLTMVGTTAVIITSTDLKIGANYKDSELAFNNAQAGTQYAIGKMEEGLKVWVGGVPGFTLPVNSTSTPANPLLSTFTAPSGFNFTLSEITEISPDSDIYEFTSSGTTTQGSTDSITVRVERLPGIMFGAFGDNKLEMKNTAGVYSYSFDDCAVLDSGTGLPTCLPPTPSDSTGEGDIGSNTAVILNMGDIVDGNTAVGETTAGSDGTYTDHGATVNGSENVDMPRIDPDPLGIIGGDYAKKLSDFSTVNDNATAIEGDNFYNSHSLGIGTSVTLMGKDTLTLKGVSGGADFYFTDIELKANSVLFIDTTFGEVNIYLTGPLDVTNGAEIVNVVKEDMVGNPVGCEGGADVPCQCAPEVLNKFDCAPCFLAPYKIGAPSDFSIFSNSTSGISIGNSVDFAGLIYAPYAEVRFDNAVTVYGAVWAYDVILVTNTILYFDTDMKDMYESGDLKIISWRDNRM